MYMAPEVINTSNKEKGYNAQMVDVWASGVLLIVMLLGQFPFDHLQNPDPNSSEAHLEVWCAAAPLPLHGPGSSQSSCSPPSAHI